MKAKDIKAGLTYCNKTGNSARRVLEIITVTLEMKRNGYQPPGERSVSFTGIYSGEQVVIFKQMRGQFIGRVNALSVDSFRSWANRVDDGQPPARGLDRIANGVSVAKALEDLIAQIDEIVTPDLAKSLTKLDEARKLLKEIRK